MKTLLLAGAFAFSTTAALAGGLHTPKGEATVVPPEIVMKDTVESGSDEWVGVLLTFLTIVLLGVGN